MIAIERFFERFRCGCASVNNEEFIGLPGSMFDGLHNRCKVTRAEEIQSAAESARMHGQRVGPSLPQICEDSAQTPQASSRGHARMENNPSMTPATDRSSNSATSDMPSEEKEKEKMRLQKLLKDFAKEAVAGIPVSMVNLRTMRKPPHLLQMDRHLTVFSLKPVDGSTAETAVEDFAVKDVGLIYKGYEVSRKFPTLGGDAGACVGLDVLRSDRRLLFHFDDNYERDKFYTCLQILRMSIDIKHAT